MKTRTESLKNRGTQLDIFQYEDRFFIGKLDEAIERYIKNNPEPNDFYVWLQKNYKELCIEL